MLPAIAMQWGGFELLKSFALDLLASAPIFLRCECVRITLF